MDNNVCMNGQIMKSMIGESHGEAPSGMDFCIVSDSSEAYHTMRLSSIQKKSRQKKDRHSGRSRRFYLQQGTPECRGQRPSAGHSAVSEWFCTADHRRRRHDNPGLLYLRRRHSSSWDGRCPWRAHCACRPECGALRRG